MEHVSLCPEVVSLSSRPGPRSPREGAPALLRLETESEVPVSTQLYRQIAVAVQNGAIPPGRRLPSARLLARDLGLHYHTVNKVYLRLREEGLVALNHRKQLLARGPRAAAAGFVAEWTDRQRGLLAEAIAGGMTPGDVLERLRRLVLRASAAPPPPLR